MNKLMKIAFSIVISLVITTFTACSANVIDVIDNYSQAIAAEGNYNIDCVNKLYQIGLIHEGPRDRLIAGINEVMNKYGSVKSTSDFNEESKDSVSWVISKEEFTQIVQDQYIKYYNSATYIDGKLVFNEAEPKFPRLTKILNATIKPTPYDEWIKGGKEVATVSFGDPVLYAKSPAKPIPYLSMLDKDIAEIENKARIPVMVLKSTAFNDPNQKSTYKNKGWYDKKYGDPSYVEYASMDRLLKAIDNLKNEINVVENAKILNEYFTDSGTTLVDNVKLTKKRTIELVSDDIPSIRLDVISFDIDVINMLYGNMEAKEGKYFIYDGKAYLLEYPVYYIRDIKAVTDGGENWVLETEKTNFKVNFYSGEIIDDKGNIVKQQDGTDPIYHVDSRTGSTSFMFGTELVTYKDVGHNKISVDNCLQILLKDYLEYIYLPNVVQDEPFIALGRRIRIDNLKGDIGTPVGHFIDKKGNPTGNTKVLATDFMGILSGFKGAGVNYENTKIKLALKYKENWLSNDEVESEDEILDDTGMIGSSQILYKTKYNADLRITYELPRKKLGVSPSIAGVDIDNTEIKGPRLYGMIVDVNPIESGLYGNWINISGEGGEIGSLEWWNKWLNANNYKYSVYIGDLKEALNKNYSYELAKEGTIILDLDTIAKIQKKYDKESERNMVRGVRTAFIVLGTILIVYGMMLPVAWLYDVNVINGPRLLDKISFGHWVAVSHQEEIPTINVGEKQYFAFGAIITRAIIICGIGALLYIIDFVEIVGYVWQLFSSIIQKIKEIVFNLF